MAKTVNSNTAENSKPQSGKKKPRGKPFRKNNPATGEKDERINRNGKPARTAELNATLDKLLHEVITVEVVNEKTKRKRRIKRTQLEQKLREMLILGKFPEISLLFAYYFGKPADEVNIHADYEDILKQNIDLLTDGQIEKLAGGQVSAKEIVIELLQDLHKAKTP